MRDIVRFPIKKSNLIAIQSLQNVNSLNLKKKIKKKIDTKIFNTMQYVLILSAAIENKTHIDMLQLSGFVYLEEYYCRKLVENNIFKRYIHKINAICCQIQLIIKQARIFIVTFSISICKSSSIFNFKLLISNLSFNSLQNEIIILEYF